jgi:dimethylamine monooxygenase subunit A
MTAKLKTPYDGSARLFQIGLKPLDPAEWIDVDDKLPEYLREKERLAAAVPDEVFAASAGTEAAQAEVLTLLAEHLPARFPEIYRRHGSDMEIVPGGRRVALDAAGVPPLWIAAALVQEDLIIMRRGETGWRLAAASLSFPSSWSLREKFGRPIDEVHGPVPGFGGGTRNAELIARMFDHLRPEMPVIRWNWSLYGDSRLFHAETASPEARRFGHGPLAENVFLRVERQTLRRLPQSRDILFTIRIYVDPLAALERHPQAPAIATALVNQVLTLSDEQLAYKGLTLERNRLAARLRQIAER